MHRRGIFSPLMIILLLFFTIFWRDIESACPHRSYKYKHHCEYCSEPHTAEEFTLTHRMMYPGKERKLRNEGEGINEFEINNVVLARNFQPEFQEVDVSKTRENQAASENDEKIQCKMISLLPLAWVQKQYGGHDVRLKSGLRGPKCSTYHSPRTGHWLGYECPIEHTGTFASLANWVAGAFYQASSKLFKEL
jgi:hypothetical protein